MGPSNILGLDEVQSVFVEVGEALPFVPLEGMHRL